MAFDSQTRNKLQRMVGACRRLLTDEFDDQLQGLYGIYAQDGRVLELYKLTSLDDAHQQTATLLRDRLKHLTSGMASEKQPLAEAVRRVLREQAFTVLNRFAALRMAEERGFVQECVGQGLKSKGFQVFETVARSGLGGAYERYVTFVHGTFDELSLDLGVLFDRWSPFGLLFPREPALLKFFDLLNDPELKPLWKEDETIGWIYQYFNDEAERKKMREESAAPRNSRELAVRNQFFTPRYVVEFLTDNTLGRIWYEMTQGNTKLKGQCRYLVRRPNEIFLKPGEKAPEQPKQDNLSQEDLLKQPAHIPHRPLKDPRTILMLDPACGSMHFGLYAFDLFEVIYEEAWELEKRGAEFQSREPGMLSLHETYGTKEDFLKDVPRLIIERNLHGIDIDPRCAQIAGLSLWLRAQKAWQRLGLKPADRPAIKRSNIVCAEPMPGEKELLREFVEREFPAEERGVCLRLLEAIFDKMQLAGEAGSLLKIEEEIRSAIEDARRQWQTARHRPEFFDAAQLATLDKRAGVQQELLAAERAAIAADLRSLTSEDFWLRIEQQIYNALRDYAEQAENGGGFQRRLFAEDAARGFAFIDVCRKRYDIAVMNPPFGEASLMSRDYLYEFISEAARDLFAGFVTRFNQCLAEGGRLGVLSNRTAFFSDFLSSWRVSNFMGRSASLQIMADLGYGVLDAVVEAAAYVCENRKSLDSLFINVLSCGDKAEAVLRSVESLKDGSQASGAVVRDMKSFSRLPDSRFLYQLHSLWIDKLNLQGEHPLFVCKAGLTSGDDTRNLRLCWEVPANAIFIRWRWLAKGGEFSRYRTDVHLLVDWSNREHLHRVRNSELYGRRGITYTERTTSNLSARVLNEGSCFSGPGPAVIPAQETALHFMLAFMNSFVATYCVESIIGGGDFSMKGTAARHLEPGYMKHLPMVELSEKQSQWFQEEVNRLLLGLGQFVEDEADALFLTPLIVRNVGLLAGLTEQTRRRFRHLGAAYQIVHSLETAIAKLFAMPEERIADAYSDTGWPWAEQHALSENVPAGLKEVDPLLPQTIPAELEARHIRFRFEMKLAHYLHGGVERYAASLGVSPMAVCAFLAEQAVPRRQALVCFAENLQAYCVGSAFGRWDIRYATGERAAPELPDPFAPLPVCPPGQLQNAQGLPARPEDVPAAYPLRIPWDGILADDPNHPLDIERRVREVIEIIWAGSAGGPTAEAIEHEACEILGVKSLREYFRKPTGFFADHLKRYSKSRRQAPIYLPLSTASGSYTLWIYCHRLTDQTLFQCVNDFVKPKLEEVNRDIERFQKPEVRDQKSARENLERLQDFAIELKEFHDELLRVAGLPYKPNLNDGLLITASPLWRLFRLPKWQKDLKACWESLEAGEYDWAHIALTIRPNEVRQKCKKDRSIAIAHGLEELCEVKAPEKKAKRGKKKTDEEQLDLPQD